MLFYKIGSIDVQKLALHLGLHVGTIPGGYLRGRPLHMYGRTTPHVPQVRTMVAPAT